MKKTPLVAILLTLGLTAGLLTSTACAKKTPATSPDAVAVKVLNAARQIGAGVAAVQAAELSYFSSGQSKIAPADQVKINAAFASTSSTVLTAIATYQQALDAPSKQQLIDAIKNGVTQIVSTLNVVSDQKLADYVGWVNTAESLFLAVAS